MDDIGVRRPRCGCWCFKALGLNTEQTALAISHALCRASGLRIANGTEAKFVGNGQVAALGITSAQFGEAGISAPLDALEVSTAWRI